MDKTIENFTKTIELDPNYTDAYYNRGIAYSHKGDFDKVIEDCSMAIAIEPDQVVSYFTRATAYGIVNSGLVKKSEQNHAMLLEKYSFLE